MKQQGNSQSADSTTDSGSAQNNPTVSPPLSVRGGGGSSSEYKQKPEQKNQLEMSNDPSRTGVGTASLTGVVGVGVGGGSTHQHKPQEKVRNPNLLLFLIPVKRRIEEDTDPKNQNSLPIIH